MSKNSAVLFFLSIVMNAARIHVWLSQKVAFIKVEVFWESHKIWRNLPLTYLQGHRTRFETFQTNNLSWFNDILIKTKTFLKSWDREIWYKIFNLCTIIFSWSQFLHIWKNQQVFCLIFAAITTKTNWSRRNLQPFSRFWRNQS